MFDVDTPDGVQRHHLCTVWTYAIACGAIVEPPRSDVPEIIVPPDAKVSSIPLPKSYKDAVTGPYRRYWIEAVRIELENLLSRKVWREEPLPRGAKAPMDDEPMPVVATGTCEAEYNALSMAVKELIWIYMLLKTMGLKVEKPCVASVLELSSNCPQPDRPRTVLKLLTYNP